MDTIEKALKSIEDDVDALERAIIALESSLLRAQASEIEAIEATPKGIYITPLGDPNVFAHQLGEELEAEWTREKDDSGLYQWVTSFDFYNTMVYIVANENVDMTGTPVITYPF